MESSQGRILHVPPKQNPQIPAVSGTLDHARASEGGVSQIKAAEISAGNLVSLAPNHIVSAAYFSPTGVDNRCQAYRLVGVYVISDWTSQT